MKNTVKLLLISMILFAGISLKAQTFTPTVNAYGYIPYLEANPLAVAQTYNVRMAVTLSFIANDLDSLAARASRGTSYGVTTNYLPVGGASALANSWLYQKALFVRDTNSFITKGLAGSSATPTFTKDSAIGKLTATTDTVTGTNISGTLSFTTTTTVRGGDSAIGEIAFIGVTYPHGCSVTITPGNPNAAILSNTTAVWISAATTTGFTLNAGSFYLKPSAHYKFYYTVIGN